MNIRVADLSLIARILKRKIRTKDIEHEVDLSAVLREILISANEFVPSESGSILIDDPLLKLNKKEDGKLYFMACFGEGSAHLAGSSLSDRVGITGETYRSGKPYFCEDVRKDDKFLPIVNEETKYECRSIICAPINIDSSIIGVIELINRMDRINYDRKDLALLEIFAGYTGTFMQNALDARRFEELSKRDNLTDLYNDRYFLQRLTWEVKRVVRDGGDIALIFYDLDSLKVINDSHGHLIGSRLLKEVADITREVFAGTNAVLTRYGGDEYIIIMPDTDIDYAVEYAERLRKNISENVFISSNGPSGPPALNIKGEVTCSIGVASLSMNVELGDNIVEMVESLIRASDSAMYEAKGLGKDRVVSYRGKLH
ncbi:phytochrome-like protein cph2 [bacterium BMS3Abin07]|nr:phytochrome-like protein cph2 [bacterium BMS3Abin07]GBE32949.1 phytochrome-like protein cph2 [bacterium BMS3Bbin05]HDL21290.1 sensor domain-containing diguanylate cyclase [Nitrospirota bacterium]HDO22849.1 sensor domain-containing diguanylate cyclase [Nitrospirota bacterium]HDZ88692.1 sensor domain-containing diguanylate cyclase [Nitrospirota bacterium]